MTPGNVDKYRLVRLLGQGAMGEVWEAENGLTGGKVAIKLLRFHSDELRERMFREGRACAKLRHKNVIAVHDVGLSAEGEPFLVMELLSGETLDEHLRQMLRLPPWHAAQHARDVARALAAAHKAEIIHRDLKPANIFLHREEGSEGPVLKVLDFGVSKSLDRSEITKHGVAVGSPAFMSPEQAGARRGLDHRTDIWSLGVVLFQMLTGKKPFEGDALQLFTKILTEPIPLVSRFVRNVDPALVAVVSRCLERDLALRYGSAEELAAILDRFTQPPSLVLGAPEVPAPVSMTFLPPELQTISTWTVPEPAAASPVSAIAAEDDEVTQPYKPPMLQAMARFPAKPPPLPPALATGPMEATIALPAPDEPAEKTVTLAGLHAPPCPSPAPGADLERSPAQATGAVAPPPLLTTMLPPPLSPPATVLPPPLPPPAAVLPPPPPAAVPSAPAERAPRKPVILAAVACLSALGLTGFLFHHFQRTPRSHHESDPPAALPPPSASTEPPRPPLPGHPGEAEPSTPQPPPGHPGEAEPPTPQPPPGHPGEVKPPTLRPPAGNPRVAKPPPPPPPPDRKPSTPPFPMPPWARMR